MLHRPLAPPSPSSPSGRAAAPALIAVAAAAGIGIALASTEGLVERSLTTALSASGGGADPSAQALVAGSEAYWLEQARRNATTGGRIEPVGWSAPAALGVSVGDLITVASGGRERVLEVVAIAELPASVTRIDTSEAPERQIAVTCRDRSAGDGRLIRFITAANRPAPNGAPERVL